MYFSKAKDANSKMAIRSAALIVVMLCVFIISSGCKSDSEQNQKTIKSSQSTSEEATTTTETTAHLETIPLDEQIETESKVTSATIETAASTTEETMAPTSETEPTKTTQKISTIIEAARETNSIVLSDDKKMEPLLSEILTITGEMTTYMSIYYQDLVSGDMISINGDRQYRSASTAKIFVLMAMYDAVAEGKLKLDQIVYYTESDYEGGAGVMQNMDLSQGYSLEQLAEYSIIHSDNIAFRMIRRITGWDRCYEYYESIIGHPTNRVITHMSAEDAGKLLKHANDSNDQNMQHMLNMMTDTEFEYAIPKYLPPKTVANKIGFYSTFFHDAALIYDNKNPYILTIYSDGLADNFAVDPANVLADLSYKIYSIR